MSVDIQESIYSELQRLCQSGQLKTSNITADYFTKKIGNCTEYGQSLFESTRSKRESGEGELATCMFF